MSAFLPPDLDPHYNVFMVDPPWPKRKGGLRAARPKQGRKLDYDTMSLPDIWTLLEENIFSKAETQHCVFLWTVDQFLHDTEKQMDEWGYKRHARIIWDKENGVAPAFTVRYSHEYLLWYYQPKLMEIDIRMRGKLPTVWREQRREHSRKPEIAYKHVEALYPNARRLDVFSRQARPGWDQFGTQADYFPPVTTHAGF